MHWKYQVIARLNFNILQNFCDFAKEEDWILAFINDSYLVDNR